LISSSKQQQEEEQNRTTRPIRSYLRLLVDDERDSEYLHFTIWIGFFLWNCDLVVVVSCDMMFEKQKRNLEDLEDFGSKTG
jgi:hypothetical protein